MTRHGGQILVDQLKLRGVSRVFSVLGESFLAALDALHDAGISWGTYQDAMCAESQWHCNAHSNNMVVVPEQGKALVKVSMSWLEKSAPSEAG